MGKQNKSIAREKEGVSIPRYEEDNEPDHDIYEDDQEVWFDYMSEEIVSAYHVLLEFIASQGVPVLDACSFPDFVEFCYKFSSGLKPAV